MTLKLGQRWGTWHQRVHLLVQLPHPAFNSGPPSKVPEKHRCHCGGCRPFPDKDPVLS